MASTDKELEQQLMEAGSKLVTPPTSVDELLPLLDQVENCLSKVEQSPTKSMQSALDPSLKALVADQLFKHSDIDVKVAVASCISEITRITAPDAPYDDDQMKDVFQLIVSSFENLADKSSRSYGKRTSILETVAKVRSCVVMLDLECDGLIIEMFQHFLKAIRDYHPDNVFTSMETIMTLVLEESEDIATELLSPLLDSVKKGNEEVLPIARKLGEKVLQSCAAKVKPYLMHAVKSLNISLNDYSEVVASILQEMAGNAEQDDVHVDDENKVENSKADEVTLDEAVPADKEESPEDDKEVPAEASKEVLEEVNKELPEEASKEVPADANSPKTAEPENDTSPRSVVSNGVTQAGEDDSLADSTSLKKQEDVNHSDQSKSIDTSNNAGQGNVDTEKLVNAESKPDQSVKKKGRKVNSSSAEASENSNDVEKKAEELPANESHGKEVPTSPTEAPSAETLPSENQKESGSKPSSPKGLAGESATGVSPTISDESLSRKAVRSKKKGEVVKDSAPPAEVIPKKASAGANDSEAKMHKRAGRKAPDGSKEDKIQTTVEASKKESDSASESDAKPPKQSSKKVDGKSNDGDGLSTKQPEDKKRQSRGKANPEKSAAKNSTKDDIKEKLPLPKSATKSSTDAEETPTTNDKRKRSSGKERVSDIDKDPKSLVGAKVKVWWPLDRTYYEGVIESFDSVKKRHKVLYDDGEMEVLNLKKQKWHFVERDPEADEEEAVDHPSPDSSSDMPLKKRVKASSDQITKHGKTDASPKRGGSVSSSKSKTASNKAVRKSKEVGKSDSKSADDSRPSKKTEDHTAGKTKDQTPKSGSKSGDTASKTTSKSKIDNVVTSKTSKSKEEAISTPKGSRSKQETPKSGRSKFETPRMSSSVKGGKPPKSGGKSNVNGTGKLKSSSSKVKEMEDRDSSTESDELPENTKKRPGSSSSKGQGSEVKSGKKRRRA